MDKEETEEKAVRKERKREKWRRGERESSLANPIDASSIALETSLATIPHAPQHVAHGQRLHATSRFLCYLSRYSIQAGHVFFKGTPFLTPVHAYVHLYNHLFQHIYPMICMIPLITHLPLQKIQKNRAFVCTGLASLGEIDTVFVSRCRYFQASCYPLRV